MGDPGTSGTTVPGMLPPWSPAFFAGAPRPGHEPSGRSSSTDLHSRPPPHLQLDPHPAVSFRFNGSEECRNRDSQAAFGSFIGHCNGADDTVDLMTSAEVGEDIQFAVRAATLSADDLFTYPRGETDAVTITARDLEGLQPGKLVSDNIIDLYVKYLNLEILSQDLEKQQQVHFFNSFFFRKFLESTEFGSRFLRAVDYEQLQRWIGGVNLFEKDYIFIPVVRRSHWSLIVVCHLGRLVSNTLGEKEGAPCILHLDPMEGKHEGFEDQVKGFLHHACLKTLQGGCHLGALLTLNEMKYVQAKVPQQDNGYDCGGDQFTNPNFETEVSDKRNQIRNQIQRLILEYGGRMQGHDNSPLDAEEKSPEEVGLVQQLRVQCDCSRRCAKETKSKKFTQEETSILLQCMLDVGRFGIKDKQGGMRWDLISQEINKCNGERSRSDDQCRRRFDTLLKAYKKLDAFCRKSGKTFGEISEVEKLDLQLATPFKKENEAWFNDLRKICCQRASLKGKLAKRQKLKCDGDGDMNRPQSSHLDLVVQRRMPSESIGSVHRKKVASKQVTIPGFGALGKELKCTLLNMIQACSMNSWIEWFEDFEEIGSLEEMCRMLAIVQGQNPWEICKHVFELRDLGVVTMVGCPQMIEDMEEWKDYQGISLSRLKVFKKFREKVLRKNPHLRTFQRIGGGDVFVAMECPLQQLRALTLSKCQELEHVDLGNFPELRFLHIYWCGKLKSVGGWEVVHKLGWIGIYYCNLYQEFPIVQRLSSLKEFTYSSVSLQGKDWQSIDFSKCVPLQRLRLEHNWSMAESMELGTLKFLEVLSFQGSGILSTIHGLKGLHALAKLDLQDCVYLRRVPELGCLKALTHLNMSWSGLVEIPGVEVLHLLTSLDLGCCQDLESLPFLGHLKALVHLNLRWTRIQEIFGIEDLIKLKTLECQSSKLLKLPNLEHLPHLQYVDVRDTPLSLEMGKSIPFWWKGALVHSSQDKGVVLVDDVSDLSDTDDFSFNANSSSED